MVVEINKDFKLLMPIKIYIFIASYYCYTIFAPNLHLQTKHMHNFMENKYEINLISVFDNPMQNPQILNMLILLELGDHICRFKRLKLFLIIFIQVTQLQLFYFEYE